MQCTGKVLGRFALHEEALDECTLHEGHSGGGGCFMRKALSMCQAARACASWQVGTVPHHHDLGLAGCPSPR